jgi:hypothetical protein
MSKSSIPEDRLPFPINHYYVVGRCDILYLAFSFLRPWRTCKVQPILLAMAIVGGTFCVPRGNRKEIAWYSVEEKKGDGA